MSTAAVVTPSGKTAVAAPTQAGGAILLSPAAVGGRRRGSKKMTKKMKKMLKALKKMKAGDAENVDLAVEGEGATADKALGAEGEYAGRRRRRTRRHRKSRRHYGLFA